MDMDSATFLVCSAASLVGEAAEEWGGVVWMMSLGVEEEEEDAAGVE